jgi:hypothetical protein
MSAKILKWAGLMLVGLVLIGLAANAIFIGTTEARLERQRAAIRAAGDPLTLADLARRPIPPESNAATYLRQARAGGDAIYNELGPAPRISTYLGIENPLSADDRKRLAAVFSAHPDVIPLLQQAAACPDYDPQLDCTVPAGAFIDNILSGTQEFRGASGVLQLRVRWLVADGQYDEALRTALLILRLARHSARNPMIVNYMVTLTLQGSAVNSANLVLRSGLVSKEVRDPLDAELVFHERMEGFAETLKSERAYTLACFHDTIPMRDFWLVGRGMWNRQESACLDLYSAIIAAARDPGPFRDVRPVLQALETAALAGPRKSILAGLLIPVFDAAFLGVARTRAVIRSLRVFAALQTHVPAGSREEPKLTALGLPASTITDPFTGDPLRVKYTPRGWVVYSVGQNLQDDVGKIDDPVQGDVGVGPPPEKPAH